MKASAVYDLDRFGNLVNTLELNNEQNGGQSKKTQKPPQLSLVGLDEPNKPWSFEVKADSQKIRQTSSYSQNLTDFGLETLKDRYLLKGEGPQDLFARVACAYADDQEHAQRLYDYMGRLWFMPATPVLSNGGANRGLPISCFLNEVNDKLHSISSLYQENLWLASNGGGIGTYWGGVRSLGEKVGKSGESSGVIPFMRVMDSLALAISQGSLRRGAAALYMDIHHPEIQEFLEIRKPTGDFNRKCLNLHHGILVTDEFMEAVRDDRDFALRSPKTGEVRQEVNARDLWQRILETRMQTGEPYLVFSDTVNKALPLHHKKEGLKVKTSNLCSEIMLPTGMDSDGKERTAVCCLSSVNVETYDQWKDEPQFLEDVFRFLDNVLQDFIQSAPDVMEKARYSAMRERSIGLGLMGFHSYLQSKGIPFESAMAKSLNLNIFKKIRQKADQVSYELALERGACPDAEKHGVMQRFSHKLAIAPTASISIICGGTSACIEPIPANIYTHKTLSGSFTVKNPYLKKRFEDLGIDNPQTWESVIAHQGSIQHLGELSEEDKAVFKTAFEIDQRVIVELAADRTPFICQAQSLNLYLAPDIEKWDLMMIHWRAWELGVKSLYYCRSKSAQRAQQPGSEEHSKKHEAAFDKTQAPTNYDECLSCQ